jgi:hypothetical protein
MRQPTAVVRMADMAILVLPVGSAAGDTFEIAAESAAIVGRDPAKS